MSPTRPLAAAASLALLATSAGAAAYCPSYTASSPSNDHDCAIEAVPGTNPTVDEWNVIFDLVAQGPSAWNGDGPTVSDIGQGCGKPEPYQSVPARFPCELLKAITRVESGWRQFCVPTLPADQVGGASRTIISFDCGYGIGQVTSGMHVGENPDFDRERVASDPFYNLATSTRILAAKWKATNCVGDNQPKVVEHWYAATWAYNGLAYVNNPNNPNYDTNRGVWKPSVGGAAPYQEKVYGFMEFNSQWQTIEPAYPNPGDIGGGSSPPALPDPDCASPTDCVNKRPTHVTACNGAAGGSGGAGAGGSGAGGEGAGGEGAGGEGAGDGSGAGGEGGAGWGGGASGDGGGGGAGAFAADDDGAVRGFVSCQCHAAGTSEGPPGWLGLATFAALASLGARRRRR